MAYTAANTAAMLHTCRIRLLGWSPSVAQSSMKPAVTRRAALAALGKNSGAITADTHWVITNRKAARTSLSCRSFFRSRTVTGREIAATTMNIHWRLLNVENHRNSNGSMAISAAKSTYKTWSSATISVQSVEFFESGRCFVDAYDVDSFSFQR